MTDFGRAIAIIIMFVLAPFILWALYHLLIGLAVLFVLVLKIIFAIATGVATAF